MIILQAQQVARFFGAEVLFDKVNLEIQDHARIGLVGVNGAGKSTLLRIIAGIDPPDQGQIVINKGTTLGYLAQNSGLDSTKTIFAEMLTVFTNLQHMAQQLKAIEQQLIERPTDTNLLANYDTLQTAFKAQNGYSYETEIKTVLNGFQFPETTYEMSVASLSGGERSRLALAKILLQKPDILILDEPTNHLDIETLNWLETYLQGYPGALLTVSHDQYFLDHVAKEIYALSRHQLKHYRGNYTNYLEQAAAEQKHAEKEYELQQTEIKKLQTFVDKNLTRASTTKRAQARQKQLDKMVRLDKPQSSEQSAHFRFEITEETGKEVLFVKDLAVGYDSVMSTPITFDVRKQQRVAIIGANGIGKSTLVKTLLDEIPALAGTFKFGANVAIGYYDQNQDQLDPKKTVLDTIWDEHPLLPEQQIRNVLGSFLFRGEDVKKMVHQLSGGEKARLLLTKLAMEKRNVLIMDEPTNHLDIQSKEVLEDALANFAGTLIFVSHDRYFINSLADTIVEIDTQGSHLYQGNYDFYLEKRAGETTVVEQKAAEPISDNQAAFIADKNKQKEVRRIKRAIENVEQQLQELDSENQRIQQAMTAPEILNDFQKLADLQSDLERNEQQQETTEALWLQASEELEQMSD
ncbi:ABC-F family ATP-binding cassette domain-containing protein [Lapidilactobacillus bayanensis]|uniref:ABC-F family ATP-binding cassette domain-containing protein n=1 Tax=Lapidilactobacillus bayanensis TaxID=2485998 RepID=UPI000F778204|nr:ABC-F family ATP-binding cassette domain-containing protein [Lapidilactobacillus bayanensis]